MNDIPFLHRFGDAMENAIRREPIPQPWARWFRSGLGFRMAAAGAMAASLIALLVVLNPFANPSPSVFASWTPVPGVVEPEVIAVAEDNCGFRPSIQTNPDGSQQAIVMPHPLIVDQRGKAAVALLVGGNGAALCLLSDDGRGWDRSNRAAMTMNELNLFVPPLTVDILVGSQISSPAATAGRSFTENGVSVMRFPAFGSEVTGVAGRVSPEVNNIEVFSVAGPTVTARVEEGFFLAWWPQETDLMTMTLVAYDESGDEVVRWSSSR